MNVEANPDDVDGTIRLFRHRLGLLGADVFIAALWTHNHHGRPPLGTVIGPAADTRDALLGWRALMCQRCTATWTGPSGEPCSWCERREAEQRVAQERLDRARADARRDANAAA